MSTDSTEKMLIAASQVLDGMLEPLEEPATEQDDSPSGGGGDSVERSEAADAFNLERCRQQYRRALQTFELVGRRVGGSVSLQFSTKMIHSVLNSVTLAGSIGMPFEDDEAWSVSRAAHLRQPATPTAIALLSHHWSAGCAGLKSHRLTRRAST